MGAVIAIVDHDACGVSLLGTRARGALGRGRAACALTAPPPRRPRRRATRSRSSGTTCSSAAAPRPPAAAQRPLAGSPAARAAVRRRSRARGAGRRRDQRCARELRPDTGSARGDTFKPPALAQRPHDIQPETPAARQIRVIRGDRVVAPGYSTSTRRTAPVRRTRTTTVAAADAPRWRTPSATSSETTSCALASTDAATRSRRPSATAARAAAGARWSSASGSSSVFLASPRPLAAQSGAAAADPRGGGAQVGVLGLQRRRRAPQLAQRLRRACRSRAPGAGRSRAARQVLRRTDRFGRHRSPSVCLSCLPWPHRATSRKPRSRSRLAAVTAAVLERICGGSPSALPEPVPSNPAERRDGKAPFSAQP